MDIDDITAQNLVIQAALEQVLNLLTPEQKERFLPEFERDLTDLRFNNGSLFRKSSDAGKVFEATASSIRGAAEF